MKTVWILNHYATQMLYSKGGRHYAFAKYLKRAGYEPVVFGCNAKHNSDHEHFLDMTGIWQSVTAKEIQVPFVIVQGRDYKGNGKQRILNMIDFYRNVKKSAKEYALLNGKPDVIYASSVHPLTLVAGIQLAKQFRVKCICEVRDLWPESLVAYGIAGAYNPAVITLRKLEKWIYHKADKLIFTADGMYDYIKEQRWEKAVPQEKVYYINNGVDLELFDYNRDHYRVEDEDLKKTEIFKVVYTGSVRKVNNLGILLDAAKLVKNERVRFLIWGDGDELEMLRQRVQEEEIPNVIFKGSVEKQYVPYITSCADLNIMHGEGGSIMRFGLSANKLFDYFAAGKPLLTDFACKHNPADRFCAGPKITDYHIESLAETIDECAAMKQEQLVCMGKRARAAAEEYDYAKLTQKLMPLL